MINATLLSKYNIPVPRYTSYPTVPYWQENIDIERWRAICGSQPETDKNGMSLYIHLPFCESLCTYCGCNKKITTNHSVEKEYIDTLLAEWQLYLQAFGKRPLIREIHLGGGTPTFFSPDNLERLITGILKTADIPSDHDFSFEGHPNNTTYYHLAMLYYLGFRRISLGVQDNDPTVQRIINRIQPFENVRRVTEYARAIGFKSVNFDLIYGLPLQSAESITRTLNQCLEVQPDRIAFYSYAHVPWTSRGQRLFDEDDLPGAAQKIGLYLTGRQIFTDNGYYDIGMDHYALQQDDLYIAYREKRLFRNFMGYTTQQSHFQVGLGVSAISDSWNAFAQNSKTVHDYTIKIKNDTLPVVKGYFLNEEDKTFRQYILNLICNNHTVLHPADRALLDEYTMHALKPMENDGLVQITDTGISVTEKGRPFIRNICSAFDLHLLRSRKNTRQLFSNAV